MLLQKNKTKPLFCLVIFITITGQYAIAQRMGHKASQNAARSPGNFNRPAGNANNRSINGGAVKSPDRTIRTNPSENQNRNSGNRTINNAPRNNGNTNISGNTVNINVNNSRNVVNNRNTVVRRNNIGTYVRPPYTWGGRRYYAYHPYIYHPFHPFYWGPVWHPWGFFIATLTATAIIVSVENEKYHYDQGVWYSQASNGYTVVQAPVGGTITTLPSNAQTVVVNNTTNYYYGGAYYEKSGSQYKVVAPPAGAVVDGLPEGGEEVKIGDQTYVKVGETYYQPVKVDGKDKYEVAQVEQ
jgi:hypothetical protein